MYTHSSLILESRQSNRYVCIRSDSQSLSTAYRYKTFLCAAVKNEPNPSIKNFSYELTYLIDYVCLIIDFDMHELI